MGFLNKLFGLPAYASEHGKMVDHMLELVHWFMLLLFIGWSIFLTYVIIRYRAGANPRAIYRGVSSTASSHIEIGVIITEVILLLGFAFPLWAARVDQFPNPDVRINAIGEQFKWSFHYPGADGKFGITDRYLISPENPVGLDIRDPNSHDDFVADTNMVIPVDKTIEIAVTSKDVIHNLALKSMRHATDADPGKVNRMWFKPIVTGNSEIVCGQLCGAGHGNMKGGLEVKKYDKFLAWEKGNQTFSQTDYGIKRLKELGITAANAPVAAAAAATPAAPATTTPPAGVPSTPAGAPAAPSDIIEVTIGAIPNVMKFDKAEFTVQTGKKVKLTFFNEKDALMHNLLIVKPGKKDAVGALADGMMAAPDAMAKAYIPESPDILFKIPKLLGLGQKDSVEFVAPEPGEYPYICTFPGHWRLMFGVMKVTP